MLYPYFQSIVWTPVRGGVLVDPVLFGVGHAFSPGHLARGPGPIQRAALRAVAEGLEPVALLGRIPVVDDHLNRHATTPDTGRAFKLVGPGVQAAMPPAAVGFQVRRHSLERRRRR